MLTRCELLQPANSRHGWGIYLGEAADLSHGGLYRTRASFQIAVLKIRKTQERDLSAMDGSRGERHGYEDSIHVAYSGGD